MTLNVLPQWSMIYAAASPKRFKNKVKQQGRQISLQIQTQRFALYLLHVLFVYKTQTDQHLFIFISLIADIISLTFRYALLL